MSIHKLGAGARLRLSLVALRSRRLGGAPRLAGRGAAGRHARRGRAGRFHARPEPLQPEPLRAGRDRLPRLPQELPQQHHHRSDAALARPHLHRAQPHQGRRRGRATTPHDQGHAVRRNLRGRVAGRAPRGRHAPRAGTARRDARPPPAARDGHADPGRAADAPTAWRPRRARSPRGRARAPPGPRRRSAHTPR